MLGRAGNRIFPPMPAFTSSVDIGQRALQHCGAARMDPALGFADPTSRGAQEIAFVYDKQRVAELRKRCWTFATRRQVLRAIDTNTLRIQPALWSAVTTYFRGSIVADQSGNLWIGRIPNNLNNDPLLTTFWEPYFGPVTASLFDSTTAYFAGELVYTAAGDGTALVYLSLQNGNSDVPATATPWDATTTFFQNQVVTYSSVAYMSLIDLNINNIPLSSPTAWTTSFVGGTGSDKWLLIGGAGSPSGVALTTLNIVYPIGVGPSSQASTANAFRKPAGYLRLCPQNPKPGVNNLGGPTGNTENDWLFEGDYLISSDVGPIPLRFVADFTDVARMDADFCEALAARIAVAVCDTITQSASQMQTVTSIFKKWESDARTIDGIEQGYVDPPEDELITVRF